MLVLALDEVVFLALILATDGACHVEARVANALQLRYLTQHGTYLGLGVVREMGIADLIKIVGNLQLHVVRYALVLLDARVELVELSLLVALFLACGRG